MAKTATRSRSAEAATDDALVRTEALDVAYGPVQVLFGVDFEVQEGEIVALLGTNGAGKSTLLKAITGLLDPGGGAIVFGGRDITHADPVACARLGVMAVPGGRSIFPTLTVSDNLKVAAWQSRSDRRATDAAIDRVLGYFPF